MKILHFKLLLVLIYMSGSVLTAQTEKEDKHFFSVASKSNNFTGAYNTQIGGISYDYHSLRGSSTPCIMARANTEAAVWETDIIKNNKSKYIEFVWLAAIDADDNPPTFTLSIDGKSIFTFSQHDAKYWSKKGEKNSELSFFPKQIDRYGDPHGYMYLKVPKSWVKNNKASIKVKGDGSASQSWYMTFKEGNTNDFIYNKSKKEAWFDLSWNKLDNSLKIIAPETFKGENTVWRIDGKEYNVKFSKSEQVVASLKLKGNYKPKTLIVFGNNKALLFKVDLGFSNEFSSIRPEEGTYAKYSSTEDKSIWSSKITISYEPTMVSSLNKVATSEIKSGKIALMNSSHQDIAWMDDVEKCIVERDTMLLTPLFNEAGEKEQYSFDIEDALIIKEYLERHPDRKEQIQKYLDDEKISIGASYIQPYEEMYSGEALARQFYFGKLWLSEEFNNYNADTYWNMDVPGRTLQMPQILAKSGVDKLVISRQARGLYNWVAPNGSKVKTFSLSHYSLDYVALSQGFATSAEHIAKNAIDWTNGYNDVDASKAIIPILSDWDMSPAKDYSDIIEQWKAITVIEKNSGESQPCILPQIELITTDKFIDIIADNTKELKEIKGERPNLWVYIHGPGHQRALNTSRKGDRMLVSAEKLSSFEAIVNEDLSRYPQEELKTAWEDKIYPDHGWGGKNGDITDAIFEKKYEDALTVANEVSYNKLEAIAGKIKNKQKGTPIVAFNTLNWERKDIVSEKLTFKDEQGKGIEVKDKKGNVQAIQLSDVKYYTSGNIKSAVVNFIATVPSNGYASYYAKAVSTLVTNKNSNSVPSRLESNYYIAKIGNGGLTSLKVKSTGKELLNTDNFLAGEVFTMESVGNGAGEFVEVQQPSMKDFDQISNHKIEWTLKSDGPIFTEISYRQPLGTAIVENTMRFYKLLPKINFEIEIKNWDGTIYREYRMALPLAEELNQVAYQVPYGIVKVGIDEFEGAAGGSATGSYNTPNKDLHPRGIANWVGAASENKSVILSSSVAVVDYLDIKDLSKINLQPILFASRTSCHWEGNKYPQTGNHHFNFSLTTGEGNWIKDNRKGIEANEPLLVTVNATESKKQTLSPNFSFVECDNENIIISAIKKAESGNGFIVRFYNTSENDQKFSLEFSEKLKEAHSCTLIEENKETLPVNKKSLNLHVEKYGISTVRVEFN